MIAKPKGYDEITIEEKEYKRVELGGHLGIIMKVEEYTSPKGNPCVKIYLDTAKEDKQPNYFSEDYKNDTRVDKKWNNKGIGYVSLGERDFEIKKLKAFITAYENSNNCTFDWSGDWEQLKGKKIGMVYGLEEYMGADGKVKTIEKIDNFRSYDKVLEAGIPRVHKIDGSYVPYEDYLVDIKKQAPTEQKQVDSVNVLPDDFPF